MSKIKRNFFLPFLLLISCFLFCSASLSSSHLTKTEKHTPVFVLFKIEKQNKILSDTYKLDAIEIAASEDLIPEFSETVMIPFFYNGKNSFGNAHCYSYHSSAREEKSISSSSPYLMSFRI